MFSDRTKKLRKIIRKCVNNRGQYLVMRELWDACRDRFWEDNVPTRKHMLIEFIEQMAEQEIFESRRAAQLADKEKLSES